jgi:CheY-like chemotaxis protein
MTDPANLPRLILLIESNADSCTALTKLLSARGYAVDCAATVAEALTKLDRHPTHVILDLMLPDGSGFTVLQYIRATAPWTKVAILSGWSSKLLKEPVQPDLILNRKSDVDRLMEWLRGAYEPDIAAGV